MYPEAEKPRRRDLSRKTIVSLALGIYSIVSFNGFIPLGILYGLLKLNLGASDFWLDLVFYGHTMGGCVVPSIVGIILAGYAMQTGKPRLTTVAIAVCSFALCFAICHALLALFIVATGILEPWPI